MDCVRKVDGWGFYKILKFREGENFVKEVEEQEGIEVIPPSSGKWTLASDGDGIECSVCGEDFCTIIHMTEKFKYCPNCGAKMSGEGLI